MLESENIVHGLGGPPFAVCAWCVGMRYVVSPVWLCHVCGSAVCVVWPWSALCTIAGVNAVYVDVSVVGVVCGGRCGGGGRSLWLL